MNESDRRLSPDLADAIRLGDELADAAWSALSKQPNRDETYHASLERFDRAWHRWVYWRGDRASSARITREETTRA